MKRRRFLWIGVAVVDLLLFTWLGVGLWVRELNTVPTPTPPARQLPAGNVYDQYVELVTSVQDPRLIMEVYRSGKTSGPDVDRVLEANGDVLQTLRRLSGKPSVVTGLLTSEKFVGALAFPHVTRLAAISVRHTAATDPDTALATFVAAAYYGTGVMRGGATLHITTGFLSLVPVFEVAPELLPKLSADRCATVADALQRMDETMTPLVEMMRAERYVRLMQLHRTVSPGAMRILRFHIPREKYEWDFLLKPKMPAYNALDAYMNRWVAEAAKPLSSVTPPAALKGLEGILADESLAPDAMGVHFIRHAYIQARIRVLHAALRLEAFRQRHGTYPPKLEACVRGEMLADPFSGNPLIYRRSGTRYELYSVGPNGADDGGTAYTESRMRPGVPGDLPLRPTF